MVEVKFHDIGEGMNEGEIIHFFVKVGDEVTVDQPLVELQTDKMVAEIPSPAAGKISKIRYQTGEVVTVGTGIIEIDDEKEHAVEEVQQGKPVQEQGTMEQEPVVQNVQKRHHRILAAPFTRKIAREHDVDIEQIQGTGPARRVTDEDVYRFIETGSLAAADETPEQPIEPDTIAYTGMRKKIGDNLTKAITTIPHVTHFDEADLTKILAFRNELKQEGESISVVAFFLKAITIALKEHRVFNAKLDQENSVIQLLKHYHIGIATNTEKGLVVPVLRNVDKKSIRQINTEMKALTKKAQDGKLTTGDMKDGTFTISNVGPLGGMGATPIINGLQTAIIAFHKTKKTPVVMDNDEIAIRQIMTMSLSFDHRVADGVASVEFTNRFIELMENPKKLLLEMV
ncbi:dihydrolipoyllysine acetyltransferase [Virgibacillus phasianinus]|uniref:Dihydrolipoamide acetyltransferase component of pyruvate dehydrogenase complex n=1 Tax=Virgibacillus phasianinus TaxID=2017483 RepID=A0A220U3G4_9BACI|nr:dihydrolipoamide acetyltransferase family protein [Virgibacillus phasianinus]ASK62627.1 dihydrolipoyllysine acetyltransferase [Virgibacillus phasianinus]